MTEVSMHGVTETEERGCGRRQGGKGDSQRCWVFAWRARCGGLESEVSRRGKGNAPHQPSSQVHHINANYFLDITSMKPQDIENNVFSFSSTFEDPSTATYMQFLQEGLRRGLPLLQP